MKTHGVIINEKERALLISHYQNKKAELTYKVNELEEEIREIEGRVTVLEKEEGAIDNPSLLTS